MRTRLLQTLALTVFIPVLASCDIIQQGTPKPGDKPKAVGPYKVHKLTEQMAIDGNWDKPQWKKVQPVTLTNWMGEKPKFFPVTQAKVLYDDQNVYVIFRAEDNYIKAVETKDNGRPYLDTCAEFFFTPDVNVAKGYFNFETNCIGAALIRYQLGGSKGVKWWSQEDIDKIERVTSFPARKVIDHEITTPTTWTIEYRIPFEVLEKYMTVVKPAPGVKWRANFYKLCGTKSDEQYITWSVVENPKPEFHLPQFFGTIEFVI